MSDYQRGYYAGSHRMWPLHKPPIPPNENIKLLMETLKGLRDEVDAFLATLCEDDPLQKLLGPSIDKADEAFEKLSKWILQDICPHNGPKMTHSNSEVECLNCNQIIGKGRE